MEGASPSGMMVGGSEGGVRVYIHDLEGFMGNVVEVVGSRG